MSSIFENEIKIQQRIARAFEDCGVTPAIAYDIGFHMTDWLSDVKILIDTYTNIQNLSNEEIRDFVYRFVSHAPNHLNAAMKLSGIGKVEDIFNVGIFEDEE